MKNIAVKFHGGSALDEKIVLFDPQKWAFNIRNLRVSLGKPKPHMNDAEPILPRKRDGFRGHGHHAFGTSSWKPSVGRAVAPRAAMYEYNCRLGGTPPFGGMTGPTAGSPVIGVSETAASGAGPDSAEDRVGVLQGGTVTNRA
jgi:hypothetical protein